MSQKKLFVAVMLAIFLKILTAIVFTLALTEMIIVDRTSSMLEEPTRENKESFINKLSYQIYLLWLPYDL